MSIPVHLSVEDWNKVLNLLAVHPYNQVAPLLNTIMQQIQIGAGRPPVNGEDRVEGGGLPS